MVDITPGDSGANKGFWRFQLRDRYGKFVKMGGSVMFDIQLPGVQGKATATGKFIGMLDLETARIEVPDSSKIPGVMSTSQDKSRAEFYAQMKIGGRAKAEIMFEILIPKGSYAYRVPDKYSSYRNSEQEILLKPSTELEVVEITTDELGRKYIKVKAI